jgi:hypothetical protein
LARWGFAALVGAAVLMSVIAGMAVAIPADVPGVALEAVPVYRLEVGGATFLGIYFVGMAFILSLQNRAFTEFGSGGVRARSLRDLPETLVTQERTLSVLLNAIAEMGDPGGDREDG